MKAKEASSRLQGKFWNHMLVMFYLSVFYLPCLKRRVNNYERTREVNVWCIQMMCYHASLLLKPSHDVEENPGPTTINEIVDHRLTVSADFSQGDVRFGQNAGKQCVAMSLTAIVYNNIHCVNVWDSSTLNTILFIGNSLYTFISSSVNKDFLLLTDVPEMVSVDNQVYCLQYSESFAGGLSLITNREPFATLEHALNQIFSSSLLNCNTALLTIGLNTGNFEAISRCF